VSSKASKQHDREHHYHQCTSLYNYTVRWWRVWLLQGTVLEHRRRIENLITVRDEHFGSVWSTCLDFIGEALQKSISGSTERVPVRCQGCQECSVASWELLLHTCRAKTLAIVYVRLPGVTTQISESISQSCPDTDDTRVILRTSLARYTGRDVANVSASLIHIILSYVRLARVRYQWGYTTIDDVIVTERIGSYVEHLRGKNKHKKSIHHHLSLPSSFDRFLKNCSENVNSARGRTFLIYSYDRNYTQ